MGPQYVGRVHLLDVEELRVSFVTRHGVLEAVRGLSVQVDKGETLGLVGESGPGKSVAMEAMLVCWTTRRCPAPHASGGEDLISLSPKQVQSVLGLEVAIVFRTRHRACTCCTVGWQIEQTIQAHRARLSRKPKHRGAIGGMSSTSSA